MPNLQNEKDFLKMHPSDAVEWLLRLDGVSSFTCDQQTSSVYFHVRNTKTGLATDYELSVPAISELIDKAEEIFNIRQYPREILFCYSEIAAEKMRIVLPPREDILKMYRATLEFLQAALQKVRAEMVQQMGQSSAELCKQIFSKTPTSRLRQFLQTPRS